MIQISDHGDGNFAVIDLDVLDSGKDLVDVLPVNYILPRNMTAGDFLNILTPNQAK